MKGKFITGILTLAVLLGLLLVPAMGVSAGDPPAGQATLLLPATVKVTPGSSFAVNVTIYNPHNIAITSAGADMVWSTPSMLGVSSVDWGVWPTHLAKGWNNATGEVYCTGGGSTEFPNITTTNIAQATVHFVAGSTEGVVTLSFIAAMTDASLILDESSTDICNWTPGDMQNLTVYIGTPKLTVAWVGSGTVKANGVLQTANPNTTNRSWDDNVTLLATPNAGWAFSSWAGQDGPNAASTYEIMDNLVENVTATFVELPPVLTVDPLSLAFSARYGNNTDSKTVTISNTGGGTLKWTIGAPPTLSPGDNWAMYNFYMPFPGYNVALPGSYNNTLTIAVTGADADNYTEFANFLPWPAGPDGAGAQRTINGGIPAVVWNATAWINKYSLDNVKQLAVMTIWAPGATPVYATVTWQYFAAHGWPYYLGKSWSYNVTQVVSLVPGGPPVLAPKTTTCYAMVVGKENILTPVGNFSCYKTVHFLNPGDIPNTTFMQTWWSDEVRNFVQQVDGGTFDYPPLDIRSLIAMAPGPATPPAPPAWLSFNKTSGSLGVGASESLLVTASSLGLNVTTYTGNFVISAPGSVQTKTVNATLEVTPATTIDVIRNLPADALDLDAEYPGDTFDVWVNFTAPVDSFATIGLTDLAPAGWAVQTNTAWCSPAASWTKGEGNKAEYAWSGPYAKDQVFSARYTVTIPATALNGYNSWPNNDGTKAWAEYWFGAVGPYTSNVTGEWQKIVTVPGKVVGETRDVNADLLTTTLVVLSEEPLQIGDEPEDSDSSTAPNALYEVWADDTGQYWMEASKYCYFALDTNAMPITRNPWHDDYIDFGTTAKLAAGAILDFEGDYGLVPKACTMSYAMKSVNHWLFVPINGLAVPHPEWQLSNWKAMESVHSWQFPTGCNL